MALVNRLRSAVELHEKRAEIERALVSRSMPLTEISRIYGPSVSALANYRDKKLRLMLRAAEQERDLEARSRARKILSWLYDQTVETVNLAKFQGNPMAMASAIGQGIKLAELQATMDGEIKKGDQQPINVNVDQRQQVVKVIGMPKLTDQAPRSLYQAQVVQGQIVEGTLVKQIESGEEKAKD